MQIEAKDLYLPVKIALLRIARSSLRDEDIEDLTQEIVFKIWLAQSKFNPEKSALNTWIGSVTKNHWLDQCRKHRVYILDNDAVAVTLPNQELLLIRDDQRKELIERTNALSGRQGEVIQLRCLGASISEVSRRINITEKSVQQLQLRAMQALKR